MTNTYEPGESPGSSITFEEVNQRNFDVDRILNAYKHHQYPLEEGEFRMNLFGIRAVGGSTNTFNDGIGVLYLDSVAAWRRRIYQATTDPGLYWLQHPENVEGTLILAPGYHKNSHKIGFHKGRRALEQVGELTIYRDPNMDHKIDLGLTMVVGPKAGVNIHDRNRDSDPTTIEKWSAGCQVIAKAPDHAEFMSLCDLHAAKWGDVFSYALFLQEAM